MKKVLLWAILCGFAIPGAMAQTGFGLKAGVNMAKMTIEVEKGVKTPSHVTYFVTAFADLPLADQFSIQPGLSLQGKGAKASIKEGENEASVRTNLMAIEIPVNAVYISLLVLENYLLVLDLTLGIISVESTRKRSMVKAQKRKLNFQGRIKI